MRAKLFSCYLLALMLLCLGCTSEENTAENKPVIGVSIMTATNPFFKLLGDTIADEAAKFGYETIVVSGDYDISKQKNQVSDFIVQGVDVIVLTPINSKSIGTSVAEANEAGIPVFTADIAVLAEGVEIVSHIATDNYQAGRVAARFAGRRDRSRAHTRKPGAHIPGAPRAAHDPQRPADPAGAGGGGGRRGLCAARPRDGHPRSPHDRHRVPRCDRCARAADAR